MKKRYLIPILVVIPIIMAFTIATVNTMTLPNENKQMIASLHLGYMFLEDRVAELEGNELPSGEKQQVEESGRDWTKTDLADLQRRVSSLESQVGYGSITQLSSLEDRVSSLEQRLGSLYGFDSLERSLNELERRVSALERETGGW